MYSSTELSLTTLLMSTKYIFFLAKGSNTISFYFFLFSSFLFPFFLFWPIISIFLQNRFPWLGHKLCGYFFFSHSVITPHLLNRYCVIKDGLLLWVLQKCSDAKVPNGLSKACLIEAKEIVEPLFRIINERSFTWGDHGVEEEEILAPYNSSWVPEPTQKVYL